MAMQNSLPTAFPHSGISWREGDGTVNPEKVPIYMKKLEHHLREGDTNDINIVTNPGISRWSEKDVRVYNASRLMGWSIDLGSDGHLYVEGDNAHHEILASLEADPEHANSLADPNNEGWMADFEPNFRINSKIMNWSILFIPNEAGGFTTLLYDRLQDNYSAP